MVTQGAEKGNTHTASCHCFCTNLVNLIVTINILSKSSRFCGFVQVGADVTSPNARPKVTIPREPNLETAQRAQRRRYIHFLLEFGKISFTIDVRFGI